VTARRFKPPLNKKFVADRGLYSVYTVDGFAIRNATEADEEFTNFATQNDFPDLVAEDDIWTTEGTYKREGRFFVANAIATLESRKAGKSEDDAFDFGNLTEQRLRERITGIKYRDGRPHKRVPRRVYVRPYFKLPDPEFPIQVWLVDGLMVRCLYKTDYTEGGHGFVYPWCPKPQIWIDKSIETAEIPYILAHEYIEHRLMRDKGFEYDRAHEVCAEMEFDLRKAPTRAKFPGLSPRHFHKDRLNALTTPEFFDYVCHTYIHGTTRIKMLVSKIASMAGL